MATRRIWVDTLLIGMALAACLGCPSTGMADEFRCPSGRWVDMGDTTAQVKAKCGAPRSRTDIMESICNEIGACATIKTGELWTYDFGRLSLTRHLRFTHDVLTLVEEGGYGKAK